MMTNHQLAKTVAIAMEETCPAWLAELIKTKKLASFLTTRINEFKLQYVREMEGKSRGEELYVMESLMPMLTTFPEGQSKKPLTPAQKTILREQLFDYAEADGEAENTESSNAEKSPTKMSAELCNIDGQTNFSNWVEINSNGSVSISSIEVGTSPTQFLGAEDNESWVVVPATDKDALLLALLKEKYAGNPGAVYDFKQFLTKNGIPLVEDFWFSFN